MNLPNLVVLAPAMRSGGSVGAVAWRHARELSRAYRVHAITRDVPDDADSGVHPILLHPMSWNWLRRFGHVPNELAFLTAARSALIGLSHRESIDLVWCHSHASTALVAGPLKRRLRAGVVMTTHGDIFDRPAGTYSADLTWFYRAVTPSAYDRADRVHALSPYMAECAVRAGASAERVRVVPNGFDPTELGWAATLPRAAQTFLPEGALRILYVGSLWNVKGVDVLLRAAAAIASRPWLRLRVTLVGDGPECKQLRALAASLGIADAVEFAGRIARAQLRACYEAADLLCIPSRSEALPTVAMEAMACGLPVVGSHTGGIPVLVDNGITGHLATPGDPEALAKCLLEASASREHLAELGARGLAKVRTQFAWSEISTQLQALAQEAILARSRDAVTHVQAG